MDVGDPKKTAALGVVAVAAIGFLVLRLMPDAKKPAPSGQSPTPESVGASPTVGESTMVSLIGDPFSHPMLARSAPTAAAGPMAANPTPAPQQLQGSGFGPVGVEALPSPNPNGMGSTGANTEPIPSAPPKTAKIAVKGILCASDTVAYLSLDGGPSSAFRVGATVTDGVIVKVITPDTIVLQRGTKTQALKVGQQAEL